jgi:hypothetical protein
MGKRDELDVVAVCRQEEETHTKAARARDKFFLLFFFWPSSSRGFTQHFNSRSESRKNRQKLYYFGNHFNFNIEFNRI